MNSGFSASSTGGVAEKHSLTDYTDCKRMLESVTKKVSWLPLVGVAVSLAGMLAMNAYFSGAFVTQESGGVKQISTVDSSQGKGRGNGSDLYSRWIGTRELLLNQRSPYSAEVTAQIQRDVWGHVLDPNNPQDPQDEYRFAYPLYVVFLLAPTVFLPFPTVQFLYVVFAAAGTVLTVRCWASFFEIKISGIFTAITCALLLGSHPVVTSLYLQQPVLFSAIAIAFAAAGIVSGSLWISGVLLALATVRPQSAVLIVGWFLLWSVAKWRERKGLALSFTLTMLALGVASEILLPGWLWEWLDGLDAYQRYTPSAPAHVQMFFGKTVGNIVTLGILLALAALAWKFRADSPTSDRFKLVTALILVSALPISPVWHSYEQVFELPALLLLFHWRQDVVRLPPILLWATIIAVGTVASQWIAAIALVVVRAAFGGNSQSYDLLWVPSLFSPLFVLIALALVGRARLKHGAIEPQLGSPSS